jgi:tryptophan synthase alpha chain
MSRIGATFKKLKEQGQKALIPYITAGDPDLETTEELIVEMASRGADIVELGVPFSDPMADGPVIQRASERALARGTKLKDILRMVERVRLRTDVPIILFSYYNPLLQFGLERLASTAREIGVDGVLVTDMVPEESEDFLHAIRNKEMDMIFLLAPTSNEERVAKVTSLASGFIYAVSRTGITGVQQRLSEAIEPLIARIKKSTELPVAVGFGISNREHVQEVWRVAEGAVVGSRIVSEIENCRERERLVTKIGKLISTLRGE